MQSQPRCCCVYTEIAACVCEGDVQMAASLTAGFAHQMPSAAPRPLTYSSVRDWKYRRLLSAHGLVARNFSSSSLVATRTRAELDYPEVIGMTNCDCGGGWGGGKGRQDALPLEFRCTAV